MSTEYKARFHQSGEQKACYNCTVVAPLGEFRSPNGPSKVLFCDVCASTFIGNGYGNEHFKSATPVMLAQVAHWLHRQLSTSLIPGQPQILIDKGELDALRISVTVLQNRYDRYVHDNRRQNEIAQIALKLHGIQDADDPELDKLFKQLWAACAKYKKDPYCGDKA